LAATSTVEELKLELILGTWVQDVFLCIVSGDLGPYHIVIQELDSTLFSRQNCWGYKRIGVSKGFTTLLTSTPSPSMSKLKYILVLEAKMRHMLGHAVVIHLLFHRRISGT